MPSSTLSLAYESSSEGDEAEIKAPPAKRKKLPVLSPNLVVPTPQDDPALHQGRARSSPFVEGQWAAYVYIPVRLDVSNRLNGVLASALQAAQSQVPSLYPIGIPPSRQYTSSLLEPRRGNEELHISLSRPIYLRSHQREDLKQAVRTLASRTSPFQASFATFTAFENDDKTRVFLALEVGAGHDELKQLSNSLSPTIDRLRQQRYYTQARFHASFAWALLSSEERSPSSLRETNAAGPSTTTSDGFPPSFPAISQLPPDLIPTLVSDHFSLLDTTKSAAFEVNTVVCQIGKDTLEYTLSGSH